jgi:AhpD family alkylhydroperoxidase
MMQARMKNPVYALPAAMAGVEQLNKATHQSGVSRQVLELVHLRVSQINGCSVCVFGGVDAARKAGVSDKLLDTVAAWRESPFFSDAERAAVALAEAATRLADGGGVSDEVWDNAADHFDESELSAIILTIAVTNFYNRINASIREPAGATWS